MGFRLWRTRPDNERLAARGKVAAGPFGDYLDVPIPDPETPLADLPLLAIDLETTGLDPNKDQILSIGFVPLDGLSITLAGADEMVLQPCVDVGQSATIHGLTDDALEGGLAIEEALARVLPALAGRVLLAHFADIEIKFLSAACRRLYGTRMPCARIDTMDVQRRIIAPGLLQPDIGELRLWAARAHYDLPVYRAHRALTDALACAELYLAQASTMSVRAETAGKGPLRLKSLS